MLCCIIYHIMLHYCVILYHTAGDLPGPVRQHRAPHLDRGVPPGLRVDGAPPGRRRISVTISIISSIDIVYYYYYYYY